MKEKFLKVKDFDEVNFLRREVGSEGKKRNIFAIIAYPGDFWRVSKSVTPNDDVFVWFGESKAYREYRKFKGSDYLEMARKHNLRLIKEKMPNITFKPELEVISDEFIEQKPRNGVLDEVEREYLSALIKPFRNKVWCIEKIRCKDDDDGSDCICIRMYKEMDIFLPFFKMNAMYKGMEERKKYTLGDLGL